MSAPPLGRQFGFARAAGRRGVFCSATPHRTAALLRRKRNPTDRRTDRRRRRSSHFLLLLPLFLLPFCSFNAFLEEDGSSRHNSLPTAEARGHRTEARNGSSLGFGDAGQSNRRWVGGRATRDGDNCYCSPSSTFFPSSTMMMTVGVTVLSKNGSKAGGGEWMEEETSQSSQSGRGRKRDDDCPPPGWRSETFRGRRGGEQQWMTTIPPLAALLGWEESAPHRWGRFLEMQQFQGSRRNKKKLGIVSAAFFHGIVFSFPSLLLP